MEFFNDIKNSGQLIMFCIEFYENISTRANTFSALLKVSGHEIYRDKLKECHEFLKTAYENGTDSLSKKMSDPDKPSVALIKELHEKLIDKFRTKTGSEKTIAAQDVILSGLCAGIYSAPPRRLECYSEMMLHDRSPEFNHFDDSEDKLKMVFNVFKGQGKGGVTKPSVMIPFPEELKPFLHFLVNCEPKRAFLFQDRNRKRYSPNSLGIRLKQLLGVGCNVLRSMYITEKYKNISKDILETATAMGHSVDVALRAYKKDIV